MSLSLIYARSENYCIGLDGDLPWSLPDEFSHFTNTTMGGTIIMGRKTYQDHNCYLGGRLNIVVSRNSGIQLDPGSLLVDSLSKAIELAEKACGEIFVIGGSGLLRRAFPLATTVYETIVDAEIGGDTFVDAFNFEAWHTDILLHHPVDPRHAFSFTVYRHVRFASMN